MRLAYCYSAVMIVDRTYTIAIEAIMSIDTFADVIFMLDERQIEDGDDTITNKEIIDELVEHFLYVFEQFGIILSSIDIDIIVDCFNNGFGKTAILRILFHIHNLQPDGQFWKNAGEYIAEYTKQQVHDKTICVVFTWISNVVIQNGILRNEWSGIYPLQQYNYPCI